jgi:hypothetical protein
VKLAFTKTESPRHNITVVRDDKTVAGLPMADYGSELPHDLAHVVVESMLELPYGFWGLVAEGASFDTLHRAAAGSRPLRRTDPVIEAHIEELLVAEGLVTLFRDPEVGGSVDDADYMDLAQEIVEMHGAELPTLLELSSLPQIRDSLAAMNRQWQALPAGESLHLVFPLANRP